MAKVTGPLFSVGARGQFAQSLVYSFWKGTNVVREYVIPANPQTGAQGDQRQTLGGLGRSVKYVQNDTVFHNFALAVTPGGQSWISKYVQFVLDNDLQDAAAFEAMKLAKVAHGAGADFDTRAAALGLTTVTVAYRDTLSTFGPGMQLYCVAKYACDQYLLDNSKFNAAPYTKEFATWVDADIVLMVADFAA